MTHVPWLGGFPCHHRYHHASPHAVVVLISAAFAGSSDKKYRDRLACLGNASAGLTLPLARTKMTTTTPSTRRFANGGSNGEPCTTSGAGFCAAHIISGPTRMISARGAGTPKQVLIQAGNSRNGGCRRSSFPLQTLHVCRAERQSARRRRFCNSSRLPLPLAGLKRRCITPTSSAWSVFYAPWHTIWCQGRPIPPRAIQFRVFGVVQPRRVVTVALRL